jgi:hypothetical protein
MTCVATVALPDEIGNRPLKKLLAGQISVPFRCHVISGLTALQGVCFLSVSTRGTSNADFQVE